MADTVLSISGESCLINSKKTYSEIDGSNAGAHGLLMNARFIQGIFDDSADPGRFARFGVSDWNAEQNTTDLINALPQWYKFGLRAFTVGFQGGGPCFTLDNNTIINNPFSPDGKKMDQAYAARMDRLIRGADALGMVVIVSGFYYAQTRFLKDEHSLVNGIRMVCDFLKNGGYTNVIYEIANEHDIHPFRKIHPYMADPQTMAGYIELARHELADSIPVGCSGGGGAIYEAVAKASDCILIHGNGCSRQQFYRLIQKAKSYSPGKPVICNEDSAAIGNLDVAVDSNASWGYYNNATKQEPPAFWEILPGEDTFFAYRMAMALGISVPELPAEKQIYLQGAEPNTVWNKKRWIRVASLFPETIDYVKYYVDGKHVYTSYDEPFSLYHESNWYQKAIECTVPGQLLEAGIYLRDGTVVRKEAILSE